MLKFTTLASGSSGNAAVISCGQTHILLDAGISARRITTGMKELGIDPAALTAILITHDHVDHIGGLAVLTKKVKAPIYATRPTCDTIALKAPCAEEQLCPCQPGFLLDLGEVLVESFPTSHDAPGSVGYAISGGGQRMALCTDLGYVTEDVKRAAAGCDLLLCETNHDEDWVKTGPYPYYLKQRILGDRGHLSNEAGAELALYAIQNGAKEVILAHLSAENNTPAHALRVVSDRLRRAGVDLEHEVRLSVAPRDALGRTCFLGGNREVVCL